MTTTNNTGRADNTNTTSDAEAEARDERAREAARKHPTYHAFSPLQREAAETALESAGGDPELVSERVGQHTQQSWEAPAPHLLTPEQGQEVYEFILSLYA